MLPVLYSTLEWRVQTDQKIIYLTFDDGPVPGPTEFVLETLAKYEAKATFFCIGDNVRKNPEIYKQIKQAGHATGNHTFNHLKGWNTTVDEYVRNVKLCSDEMRLHENRTPELFRPPYGRISRKQIHELSEFRIVMWDVLTHDYNSALSETRCLQGSIRATRPGSIVVFHDSLKAEKNMTYALPRYMAYFKSAGFRFEALVNG